MSKIIVSSSSNSDEREIDEYHDKSSFSGSSDNSSNNSSDGGNTTNEQYLSGVPGVPLEVLQEKMRTRMASGSLIGTFASAPRLPLQVKRKLYIVVLQESILRWTRLNLIPLGVSTRSWMTLTLVWLSVVNGAVILILGLAYTRLIF